MIPHFVAGLFGLWPFVVVPVLEVDPPGNAGSGADPGSAGESAPRYVYSISCVEGSTGRKSFSTEDEYCSALRGEQVCSESAAFFALLQGCP
ncbi:hypothetical protein [Sorangium cellulosum]|uniref:Uncharacterized protein n=1 Tax=Sorangium cellulosum TaxID=56 RepID=A0A150QI33_SORCE|nr:hypothetical protein [Sorangium cellulosum]KYF67522.1 hypothetical protein BE15_26225 [Sorangium cellulosum]